MPRPADAGAPTGELRARILAAPDVILNDAQVMEALVRAGDEGRGRNVVDLRGAAMARLETRIDRLTDMHRTVVAAAYDTIAGMQQVHRAVLAILDFEDAAALAAEVEAVVAPILKVDRLRILVEADGEPAIPGDEGGLAVVPVGFVSHFLGEEGKDRRVTLRQVGEAQRTVYGGIDVGSEACLALEFGAERQPGLALLGATDPGRFSPRQGTDLLEFLAGALERVIGRHLS